MHDDDLERTLHDSLEQRARHLGEPNVSLDAVWNRVDRRRNRRRGIAVVGSCAAVGIGVLGIAALAGRTPDEDQSAGGGPSTASLNVVFTTTTIPPNGTLWRCVGEIGGDGTYRFFEFCEPIPGSTPLTLPPEYVGTAPPPPSPEIVYRQGDDLPQLRELEVSYEVGVGDSLQSIAASFDIQIEALINYNAWTDGYEHPLFPGDLIQIPPNFIPGVTGVLVIDCNSGGITTTTMTNAVCADVDVTATTALAEIAIATTTTTP